MNPHPILMAEGLDLGYDDEPSLLKSISFSISPNDFVGISGPNGAGKTTFVRALLGQIPPRAGRITYYSPSGNPIPKLNIGYMPQQNVLDKSFPISVEEVVRSGLYVAKDRLTHKETRSKIEQALRAVALSDYQGRPIGKLSGGQLQRVLLARAIVSSPDLLVLDEPATFVDRVFENALCGLLPVLQRHSAIIMVSHNLPQLRQLATRIVHIDHSLIEE